MSIVALPLALRPPRPSDRARVAEIVRATGVFRPSETDIALEVFDGAVQKPGVDYHALGAYDETDQLIGFACYGSTPGTEATWDLYWIAVDPGTHRRGTGRALMAACEQAIADAGGRQREAIGVTVQPHELQRVGADVESRDRLVTAFKWKPHDPPRFRHRAARRRRAH